MRHAGERQEAEGLSGSANPKRLVWNLPNATGLAVIHGVGWKGLILAPDATVTSAGRPQLSGQLIANTIPTSDWVLGYVPFTGCLQPVSGSPDLSSTAPATNHTATGQWVAGKQRRSSENDARA